MTEFAIVGPMLLLLAFGVFDFGLGMSANVTVTNSSREGARYLVGNAVTKGSATSWGSSCYGTGTSPAAPATDSAQGKAWRQLQNSSLDMTKVTMTVRFYRAADDPASSSADVTVTCSGGSLVVNSNGYSPAPGDWVQFEVSYSYVPTTPLIKAIFSQVSMDRVTTMVLE